MGNGSVEREKENSSGRRAESKGVSQGESQAVGKPQPMSPVEQQRQSVI